MNYVLTLLDGIVKRLLCIIVPNTEFIMDQFIFLVNMYE